SEIFAGAIQDWDRGIIAGRRTFGKGLVQSSFPLNDGSQIRLTIARYYTPTGRSIQSPYGEGYAKYIENYLKRFKNGERFNADNIKLPDSLKCYTLVNKRTVYGGGGIMPDVFISADTSWVTDYYIDLRSKEIFNSFILEYTDKNRNKILSEYKGIEDFRNRFEFSNEDIAWFIKMGNDAGIKYNDYQFNISKKEILKILKALVANTFWQSNGYFMIINENDNEINRILNLFYDPNEYRKILGY
ncbi:MAG TPA: peptidase S41, partial [Bacteroidales bacterium]|nr:peptidase S41 [Bacteroidales bacterium]